MSDVEIDPAQFRHVLARYATGVVVVSTCVGGVDHAMTANSFTSVSLDPALVLVCVDRGSRFHEAVMATSSWAVSILAADSEPQAAWFAQRGRPLADQFAGVASRRGPTSGALLVAGALVHLECRTHAVFPGGDHDILVGRVESMSPADEREPLLYYRHRFRRLGSGQ